MAPWPITWPRFKHLLTFDHEVYWPGHGGPVREPSRYVRGLAAHRRRRERMVLDAVRNGAEDIDAIVEAAYPAIAPALAGAASLSTLAHLEWLVERAKSSRKPGACASMRAIARRDRACPESKCRSFRDRPEISPSSPCRSDQGCRAMRRTSTRMPSSVVMRRTTASLGQRMRKLGAVAAKRA